MRWSALGLLLLAAAVPPARGEEPAPAPAGAEAGPPAPSELPPREAGPPLGGDRSYAIPAAEVGGLYLIWNGAGRLMGKDYSKVTWDSIKHNLEPGAWWWDHDYMSVNQLGHPLQGSQNYLTARSTGNGFWVSSGYAFGASLLWEIAGETEPPAYNDQITTPVGGAVFGEVMYRLHALLIQNMKPGPWREVAAFGVAPVAGMNRAMFGDRFRSPEFDEVRSFYTQLGLGAGVGSSPGGEQAWGGSAQFHISYGIPGDPALELRRPFDHFDARLGISVGKKVTADVLTRGLLFGERVGGDSSWRGLWGCYGLYDYIAPEVLRASAVAVGVGIDGQWALSRTTTIQTAALVGPSFGADGVTAQPQGERDQHMGPGVMGFLQAQAFFADRVRVELEWRQYYVGDLVDTSGTDTLGYGNASVAVRLAGRHGLSLQATTARRRASYVSQPATHQIGRTFSVFYELLGDGMGAAPRPAAAD